MNKIIRQFVVASALLVAISVPPPPISWINTAHAQTDSTAPTAAFSDVDNGVIGTEQSVLLTFSEAVTDLTASDFSTSAGVTGIRVSDPDSDQTTYTIAFTPSSQAIVLRLAANSVMDTAAIPNEGPARLVEQALRATDPDMPSLVGTYASIAAGEINTRQMLTFTFSEPVTGLTVDAFTIGGGEVNSITPSSGYHTTYTLTLTPTSTGQVVLRLLANSVTDRDGNTGPGIPATLTTFSLGAPDTTAPTVDFGTIDVGVIGTRQTHTIRFNQIVTGFAATDITATGATVNSLSGSGDTYMITFTPTLTSFTLTLAADSVSDTAATPNTGPAAEPAAARSVTGSAVLSADADLATLSITDNNGNPVTPNEAIAPDTLTYTATAPSDTTSVTITVTAADSNAEVDLDSLGTNTENFGFRDAMQSFAIEITAEDGTTMKLYRLTITRAAPVITNTAPLTPFAVTIPALGKSTVDNRASVKIDFGRAVTGLTAGDFTVSNGAVNSIDPAAGSNTAYIVVYTPITTGAVTLTLAANAVTDGDGNPNLAASATGTAAVAATATTSQPSFTATTTIAGLTTAEFDEDKFEMGIATLLTIPVGDVRIISIAAGSVVVEYEVVANTDAERDARAAALSAATQSELRNAIDQNIPSNAAVTTVIGESTAVAAVKVILPEVVRAMADSTVSTIARRIEQATASGQAAATLTLDGRALALTALANAGSLSDALNSPGVGETLAATTRALADGSWQLNRVLGNSAFVLPIATTDHAWINQLAFWGGGDYRNLSGKGGALDWDGKLVSARLGADAQVADTLLAGLTISWQHGTFGYDDADALRGTYDVEQTSIHPYLGWSALDGRLDLWATVGYGWGEVEIDKQRATGQVADLTTTTIGGGGSARLLESNAGTLRLKGEIVQTQADVDDNADMVTELTVDARRLRLTLEGTQEHQFADGARLIPTMEVGLRHDTGDGRTGLGAEFGGSLRFSDPSSGLTVESRGRVLLGHSGDYNDWGLGGTVRFAPGTNGRGLAVSLQPSYGATASRVSELWTQEAAVVPTAATTPQGGQMNIDISYGLDWTESFLTPYTRLSLTNTHTQAYRLGTRLQMEDGLIFSLEALRQESLTQPVDHGILLKLDLNW